MTISTNRRGSMLLELAFAAVIVAELLYVMGRYAAMGLDAAQRLAAADAAVKREWVR